MLRRTIDNFFRNDIVKFGRWEHLNNTKTNDIVKLGRWEHRNNTKTNEIKLLLANHDHCGDNICGTPKPINELLSDTK